MATIAMTAYGQAGMHLAAGRINWLADDLRVMLLGSGYTPSQDGHDYLDDVSNEVSGTGYTAGGLALTNPTLTYDAGTNTTRLTADAAVWSVVSVTWRYAVIYDRTPATNATRPLIAYGLASADISTTDGTLTLTWPAAGIVTIAAA